MASLSVINAVRRAARHRAGECVRRTAATFNLNGIRRKVIWDPDPCSGSR
jgi:hypothetical protein